MDDLVTLLVNGGIVAALLEAFKRALGEHFNWTRYGALLSLVVGVLTAEGAVLLDWYGIDGIGYEQAVFAGLMAGITASGLNRGVTQSAPTVVVAGKVVEGAPAVASIEEPAGMAPTSVPGPTTEELEQRLDELITELAQRRAATGLRGQ